MTAWPLLARRSEVASANSLHSPSQERNAPDLRTLQCSTDLEKAFNNHRIPNPLHGESLTPNSLTPSRRLQPEGVGVMIPPHPTYFPQKPRDLVNGAAYEKCLKIESALDVLNTPPVVRHIKELPKPTDSSRARQHQLAKSVSAEDNQSGPGPSASTTSGFTRPCCASLQQRMYNS